MMKRKLCFAAFMMASGLLSAAAPLVRFDGALTDKLPGWKFKASNPKNGMTYNPFEGYYPDKGGKLSSNRIRLDKKPGESAYYRIRFDARAPERAYQGVDFFDAAGNLLPDCYDVVYPGENGQPLNSLRLKVFYDGLQDFAAMRLLESLVGREKALEIIVRDDEFSFLKYPHGSSYLIALRERVNQAIKENI